MRIVSIFLIIIFLPALVCAQDIVDIIDLHINDANGEPHPSIFHEYVTIRGVVTCPVGVLSTSEIHIQDETGGISIYGSITGNPQLGDEMEISGQVEQYSGLTELQNMTQIDVLSQGNPVPEPLVLTCSQVAASFDPVTYADENEGRFIRIDQVTYEFDYNAGTNIVGILTDGSGTCAIFLDGTANLAEPPSGMLFDVIGILKQYDISAPYTGGYQIVPRFPEDFEYGSGPLIVAGPVETEIQPDQVTLQWETSEPCSSVIQYGLTTAYESGTITFDNLTTTHEVTISGLTSATVYHCRVIAENDNGAIYGQDHVFAAASALSSGEIQAYFSQSVDVSYAGQVEAVTANLSAVFSQLVDEAQSSIDFCFYNLSRQGIANKLVDARDRGVEVRVIYEEDYSNDVIEYLVNNGIPVINDGNSGHYMHNKFAIFDHGDDDETNDIVWTGSWNASFAGTYDNAEHALTIRDASLAAAYTLEFEEMWAGNFGSSKTNNTPHYFNINGLWVQQYMSPSDGLNHKLEWIIDRADHDLFFCIYSFTLNEISDAMQTRFQAGVNVRGVFDVLQASSDYSEWDFMSTWADVHLDQ
ncbi:MAG: hypothetical protein GY869_31680, partial [Planctomycetes bacterium]|nr:hypothetical protein [Planctomycetota bacterium]